MGRDGAVCVTWVRANMGRPELLRALEDRNRGREEYVLHSGWAVFYMSRRRETCFVLFWSVPLTGPSPGPAADEAAVTEGLSRAQG